MRGVNCITFSPKNSIRIIKINYGMKSEIVESLSNNFEDHSQTTQNGIEFWFARDIQHLLGYSEWRNFQKVIIKAKTSCEATDNDVLDHFVEVNKMVKLSERLKILC